VRPWFLAWILCVFLGCSRDEKRAERTAPWLASAPASAGSVSPPLAPARLEVVASEVTFELPAKRATVRGRLLGATGSFDYNLEDPKASSGSMRFDLTKLEIDDAAGAKSEDTTRRALEWLELGSEVAAETREPRRFATFTFATLEGTDFHVKRSLGKPVFVEPVATGELSLHGVRVPVRVPVRLEIDLPGAADKPPSRLVIRSRKPLVVSLGVHDIRPRDARGVLVARELTLLGDTVGREAKVTFELTLAPRP
jgi:polyisoprenoid-binding protein YceI